jgi:hypothetical protein
VGVWGTPNSRVELTSTEKTSFSMEFFLGQVRMIIGLNKHDAPLSFII